MVKAASSQQFHACNPIIPATKIMINIDQHLRLPQMLRLPCPMVPEADPLGDTKVVDRSAMDRDFDALGKPGKSQAFPGNESMTTVPWWLAGW